MSRFHKIIPEMLSFLNFDGRIIQGAEGGGRSEGRIILG
jgi:hypothetical protein